MCAAAAFASRADDPAAEARARVLAADDRWRVREGVAIGLQLLGDDDPAALVRIVASWTDDPLPFVQRAAIAAICEPRLLGEAAVADAALAACVRVTSHYTELSTPRRRTPDARSLRQALGYCWSVAIVARPVDGMMAFSALDPTDRDVAWIRDQNRRKKRLAAILARSAQT